MKKVDFTHMQVQISFDGQYRTVNVAKDLGNDMMFNSSVLSDIGFEDLARKIYYSEGPVEIPEQYIQPMLRVISECNYIATVKRYLTKALSEETDSQ